MTQIELMSGYVGETPVTFVMSIDACMQGAMEMGHESHHDIYLRVGIGPEHVDEIYAEKTRGLTDAQAPQRSALVDEPDFQEEYDKAIDHT